MAACLSCGNNIASTKAGSLTQFVLGKSGCSCNKSAPHLAKIAKAKLEISYCSRCSKKIKNKSHASLTAFLQNRNYCNCKRTVIVQKTSAVLKASQLTSNSKDAEQAVIQAQLQQELETAQTLANTYKLVDSLGEGGMSYVYLAEHTRLHRLVALKVMKADLEIENNEALFREEARKLVLLNHQSLVKVLDFALHRGKWPLIAMEIISGETLAERLDRLGPMEVDEALSVFKKVAEGLSYIHLKGLVHKDLKPGNIMLTKISDIDDHEDKKRASETEVKILDFGISQLNQYGAIALPSTTAVIGSPCYMSPEVWQSGAVSPRTDLYALGCSLYEALTGHTPYEGENIGQIKEQHINAPYPGLTTNAINTQYSIELELLLKNLLAKNPDERPVSAQAVLNTLSKLAEEPFKKIQSNSIIASNKSFRIKAAVAAAATIAIAASSSIYFAQRLPKGRAIPGRNEVSIAKSNPKEYSGLNFIAVVANSISKGDKDVADLPRMITENPTKSYIKQNPPKPIKTSQIGNICTLSIPPGVTIGYLQTINGVVTSTRILENDVLFDTKAGKLFWAFDITGLNRQNGMDNYINNMGKLPLYGIRFITDNNDKISEAVFKIKSLKSLEIRAREQTECCVPTELGTVKNLHFLSVLRRNYTSDGDVPNETINKGHDADKVATLPFLLNLKFLMVGDLGDLTKLLTKLSASQNLNCLIIDDSRMTIDNCQSLAKLKKLKWLVIRRTKLEPPSVSALLSMTNVEYLDLYGNYITVNQFNEIPSHSSLKCLFVSIEKTGLSPLAFANLKQKLAARNIQLKVKPETWTARGFWDDPLAAYALK